MVPTQPILSITSTGLHHLMESSDSIALLKLGHAFTDFVYDSRDVIALVQRL